MDYDKLKKERFSGTKIYSFDMITAVTQRSINNQLSKMHKVNPTLQKLTLNSDDPDDDYSSLEADLGPPTIELRLDAENRITIFCLNIKKATLKYLKIKGRNVLEEKLELPSCVLALWVNLTFEGVEFQNLPKEVQDRLKVANDYSVRQLLVDFTSASLARLDEQRTTIQNHITDTTAHAQFNLFMQTYFIELAKRKSDFVLHYLPLATTEGQKEYAMPTVAPTDFMFQNIPFIVSDTDKGKPSDDNMLVYLQMTGNEPLPRELLATSANWVVPTPDNTDRYDGTVALSRKIFLEGWLLPKLTEFNKRSSYVVTEGRSESGGIFSAVDKVFLDGHMERDDATTEDLLFKPRSDVAQAVLAFLNPQTPGRWYEYSFPSEKHDDGVGFSATTNNYMFIPEGYNNDGKCEILLGGSTQLNFDFHSDSTGSIKGDWKASIIFDGVNDGELVIQLNDLDLTPDENISDEWKNRGEVTHVSVPAKDKMKQLNLSYLLQDMQDVFSNEWEFVLPGAGDFYINRAAFNKEEDLLCELKYKF